MAKHVRFGGDGYDVDRIIRWDSDTSKETLTLYMAGITNPVVLSLKGAQAKAILKYLESATDIRPPVEDE